MRMLDAQFTIRDRGAKLRGDLGGWTHIFQKNFISPRFFLRMARYSEILYIFVEHNHPIINNLRSQRICYQNKPS